MAGTEAGLGAEVIATGSADWLNAPSSGAFLLATLDMVDFALPNTATIPPTIHLSPIVGRDCLDSY